MSSSEIFIAGLKRGVDESGRSIASPFVTYMGFEQHINHAYGRRNTETMPDSRGRISYLFAGIKSLMSAHHSGQYDQEKEFIAEINARLVVVNQALPDGKYLAPEIVDKYRLICGYCNHRPCQCPEKNRDPFRPQIPVDPIQLEWGIRRNQINLHEIYPNKRKTTTFLLMRLMAEVIEINGLDYLLSRSGNWNEANLKLYRAELADGFARLSAFATRRRVDIERESITRYGSGCWECGCKVCSCKNINFESGFHHAKHVSTLG